MNTDNNSSMDSLNNLNNEPVTPIEPTPATGEVPTTEPVAPVEEPITVPTSEPVAESSPVLETSAPVNETVQDIVPNEEPINPVGDTPQESTPIENPVPPSDVVTLTPGEEGQKTEEAPVNELNNPTTPDLSQGPVAAIPISSDVTPQNPVVDNPVVGNDQTAVGFEEKKSNGAKLKTPLIIVAALVVLGALGYFVILPFVQNTFMVTPKKVFENTITSLKTQINNTLNNANITNTINDISFKIDTDIEGMEEFKEFTYGVRFGIDNKAKALEGKAYMLDKNNKEYNILGYAKGEDLIVKLSHDERLVKVGKTSDIEGFDDIFDAAENINIDDYSYLINKAADSVLGTFKDEDFVKSDSTIKVNNTDIKVKKNTYVLNKDRIKNLYNTVVNDIYNDSKCMTIINDWGMTKEEFKKEIIDGVNFDDIKDDTSININIYLNSKNEMVGFDLANDKDEKPIYYYSNEGNFNFYMGDPSDKDSDSITADGVVNGDATDVTIKSGSETVATLKVYTWTEEEIKFDFTINTETSDGQNISGSIDLKYTRNNDSNNININATLKSGSDKISFTLNLKQELNAKIADIDASKAVSLSDEEMNKWAEEFLKSLDDTPFGFYSQMLEGMNQSQYYTDDSKCGPGVKCDDTFASRDVGF